MGQLGDDVTVLFVSDEFYDRPSSSPTACRRLVASVRRMCPTWRIVAGTVGVPPDWLQNSEVIAAPIEPLDSVNRFSNKIAALRDCNIKSGWVLFLDCDVLLCKDIRCLDLSYQVAGVHSDYPNESTREGNGKAVYRRCEVPFPRQRVPCTMYGEATYPTLNAGVLFFHTDILPGLVDTWIRFFRRCRSLRLGSCNTYIEQMCLMPALNVRGISYNLLSAEYNWNGTIAPATDEVAILHYHREDILQSDPVAIRTLNDLREAGLLS